MNKSKKYEPTPNKLRRAIIGQVQKFQEMSKEVSFISPVNCKLKNITSSNSIRNIRAKTHIVCSKWGKDYEDVEVMLKLAESMRKSYVNLIFRTDFIRNPKVQKLLDEVPLTLWKIIKDYEGKGPEHTQARVNEWREYWFDETKWERNIGWERKVDEEREYFKKIYGVDPKEYEPKSL